MKFQIIATAITLASAGSRNYRSESHHRHNAREAERERRANLDYEDIETANQDHVERFDEPSERSDSRKSNRIGVYSTHSTHSIQVAKNKAQRRQLKLSVKDSEASGTQFEGTHYGAYGGGQQIQQIHTHQLLTDQGLVPIYQGGGQGPQQHLVLTSGLGVSGLGDAGGQLGQLGQSPPLILAGGGQLGHPHQHPHAHAQLFAQNQAIAQGQDNELGPLGSDITKSVYVFRYN